MFLFVVSNNLIIKHTSVSSKLQWILMIRNGEPKDYHHPEPWGTRPGNEVESPQTPLEIQIGSRVVVQIQKDAPGVS